MNPSKKYVFYSEVVEDTILLLINESKDSEIPINKNNSYSNFEAIIQEKKGLKILDSKKKISNKFQIIYFKGESGKFYILKRYALNYIKDEEIEEENIRCQIASIYNEYFLMAFHNISKCSSESLQFNILNLCKQKILVLEILIIYNQCFLSDYIISKTLHDFSNIIQLFQNMSKLINEWDKFDFLEYHISDSNILVNLQNDGNIELLLINLKPNKLITLENCEIDDENINSENLFLSPEEFQAHYIKDNIEFEIPFPLILPEKSKIYSLAILIFKQLIKFQSNIDENNWKPDTMYNYQIKLVEKDHFNFLNKVNNFFDYFEAEFNDLPSLKILITECLNFIPIKRPSCLDILIELEKNLIKKSLVNKENGFHQDLLIKVENLSRSNSISENRLE